MIRLLLILVLALPSLAGAVTIAGRDMAGQNLICGPGSAADNSLPCSPNDVLSGVFTNVGLFQINAGTTVFVTPSIPLIVYASTISVYGTLNGSGRGEVGGIGGDPGQPGGNGAGRGPGIGAYTEMGGGGGAYGGNGGDGSGTDGVLGIGGAAYDDTSLPVSTGSIYPGSGGGGGGGSGTQTGGSGGQGGAAIYLEASSFTLTGTVFARGVPGGNSTRPADAGGGGGGGGLLLRCPDSAAVTGAINASGGKGGDASAVGDEVPYPGGGGGGGRVKIYYRQAVLSAAISVAGGAKGVKSANGPEGVPNAEPGDAGAVSYGTVAAPPSGLTLQDVAATALTWSWTASPDWGDAGAASRKYRIYSGTVSYRTPDRQPQLTAPEGAVSAIETGLMPNTTYTRYVTAFTDHSDSLPTNSVSTCTLATPPGPAVSTFSAVAAASLALNWSAGAPANPAYTSYEVNRSTDLNFGIDVSTSYAAALSSAPAGLAPNTTYYFRVRALNLDGLPTAFTPAVSTATLAAQPGALAYSGVNSTGFSLVWDGGANPPQTLYIAEISTDNFATLSRSSATYNAGAAFSGLAVNTLYYGRVKAQNHTGLDTSFAVPVTTITDTAPPLNAAVPFTNLSAGALTFNWEANGNSAGTGYNPELSVNGDFSAPVSSAATTNLNHVFTGLSVNATYYARVRAIGRDGLAGAYSSPAVSTVTLTSPPVAAVPPFSEVLASGLTFTWVSGGNPAGTLYSAELSRDGFVSVSSAVLTNGLSASFSGLQTNSVYQARVRAVNYAGVPGEYSSPIVSTATTVSEPAGVAAPFSNLSASGLTFAWGDAGNAAGTTYNPVISTNSDFSAPVSSGVTVNLNYVFTGLLVNATYYARVRAIGVGGGATAYTAAVSTVTYTLAPAVTFAPFSGVATTGLTFNWGDGGNPAGTLYAAELSRDSFATLIASVSTPTAGAAFSGLAPNTVYQARAKAVNFLGVDGPYSAPIRSTATLAAAPENSDQPFTAVSASTFTFTWGAGGNPGGTSYAVEISSSGFSAGTAISSAATLALSQTFSGLLPNTTYSVRVKAVNMDGIPSGSPEVVAVVTFSLAPASPAFSGVNSSGLTLGWTAGGNPADTTYIAELSGDGFVSVSSAVVTSALSATFAELEANSVYQARVRAVNFDGVPGPYSSPIVSTATTSSPPGDAAVPFSDLSAQGLTFAWEGGGNSPGTDFNPVISTSSDFSAPVSSGVTADFNYVFSGLSPNATYYARVRALGVGGDATSYTASVSTVTLTLPPAAAAMPFGAVSASGFTFSWSGGGNPAGTLYTAEISRDGFVTVSSAVQTSALNAVFFALEANTAYQARVRAVNHAGVPGQYSSPIVSTATTVSAPASIASPFSNLSAGGLTFAWDDGGNAAGTSYNPVISTSSDFSAPVSSAVTTNLYYAFTGLSVNATYYARVRALGAGGGSTAYTGAVSTVTHALAPGLAAAPFTGVGTDAFSLNWDAGGNPPGTSYEAELSGDNFATLVASSSTLAYNAAFSGLTPNTVYQARVKAVNFLGVDGPYSAPARSTATLATSPANVGQPFTSVSDSAVTFTWADGGNPGGTSYTVELSSADFAPDTAVSSAATLALSQTFSGLLPNTTYYGRARAVNRNNAPSGYSPALAVVTLPLAPATASPPFGGVSSAGLTFGWTANGNPQNTAYVAEISKDNFVSVAFTSATPNATAIFTGLTPNTTYTARVRAINFGGTPGPYSAPIVSTATLAGLPGSAVPAITLTGAGLTLHWSAGVNPAGTQYESDVSTRPDFSPLWSSAGTGGFSQSFALASNTTYYARVRARNHNGIPTADLALGSGLTYAAPPSVAASTTTGPVSVTTFTFANAVSTGTGGLSYYRTAWDRSPTHVWNDLEPDWTGLELLTTTATGNGYWYLHLRSYNFNGLGYETADVGPFHVALSTVLPPGQPVPVPGAFTATSGITWNWPPAIAFGDTAISTYVVSVGTAPADFSVLVDSEIGPLASFTLDPAVNGKIYYLKVRAIDEGGILSQYSPVSSPGVLVDRTPPERLGAVEADRKFSYDSNILFSWSPAADPESGIKDYLLDVGTSLYGSDIHSAKNVGLALSYQATGLPVGKAVFARVRVENNAGGFSEYSVPGPGVPVWTLDQAPPMVRPYNWPNPFNPSAGPTQIGFYLKGPAPVTLKLFTLEGDLVYEETRAEGTAGNKVRVWAGRNGTGKTVAPGGYVCLIEKRYPGGTERQQFKLAVLY